MKIIQNRKFFYYLSGSLLIASVAVIAFLGIRLGIDFTGGTLLEVAYTVERPSPESINDVVGTDLGIESLVLQAVGEKGYLLRMPYISDETRRAIINGLRAEIGDDGTGPESIKNESNQLTGSGEFGEIGLDLEFEGESENDVQAMTDDQNRLVEQRFETIGPAIGQELAWKSIQAVLVVLVAILIYVAWAFRKVSWPVQSWKYGLVALLTLFHDVLITMGIYTVLTHIYTWELNTAFVAAILTILGYSVNDTIVVFDRVRENVPRESGSFEEVVNLSVNQTVSRSLITSFTTLMVLLAIIIIGGTSIQSFVTALAIGVVIGTYSSIFVASPLLVTIQERSKK